MGQVGDPEPDGDRRRRGDHDPGDRRILVPQPGQEVHTVHPRQLGRHDHVAGRARPQPDQRFGRRRARPEAPVIGGRERSEGARLAHEQDVATHEPLIGQTPGPEERFKKTAG
jgi:hypothetical protein